MQTLYNLCTITTVYGQDVPLDHFAISVYKKKVGEHIKLGPTVVSWKPIILLKSKVATVSTEYIYYYLKSIPGAITYNGIIASTNMYDVRQIKVPVVSNEKQMEFINQIKTIDETSTKLMELARAKVDEAQLYCKNLALELNK